MKVNWKPLVSYFLFVIVFQIVLFYLGVDVGVSLVLWFCTTLPMISAGSWFLRKAFEYKDSIETRSNFESNPLPVGNWMDITVDMRFRDNGHAVTCQCKHCDAEGARKNRERHKYSRYR